MVNISEIAVTFNSKTSRYGGHLYKQGKHITGTLYAAASGNLTALTITKNTAVDGLSIAEASIYFCDVATVSGNPFNLAASKYTMVGISPVRTTTSSGTTTTSGPCLAFYDGSNTVIYAYKGTTGTMTNYFSDMVIDYVTA